MELYGDGGWGEVPSIIIFEKPRSFSVCVCVFLIPEYHAVCVQSNGFLLLFSENIVSHMEIEQHKRGLLCQSPRTLCFYMYSADIEPENLRKLNIFNVIFEMRNKFFDKNHFHICVQFLVE